MPGHRHAKRAGERSTGEGGKPSYGGGIAAKYPRGPVETHAEMGLRRDYRLIEA